MAAKQRTGNMAEDRYNLARIPTLLVELDDGRTYEIDMRLVIESDAPAARWLHATVAGLQNNRSALVPDLPPDAEEAYQLGQRIRCGEDVQLPPWLKLSKVG